MAIKLFRIMLAALMLCSAVSVFAQNDEVTNVVEVNGVVINSTDVRREMNMMYQQAVMQGVYPDDSQIGAYWNQALDTLIGRELLFQDAESKNYSANDEEMQQYIDGLITNYGGQEALEEALSEQGLTLEKLKSDTAKYQIIGEYVEKEFRSEIEVTNDETQAYYTENEEHFVKEETISASHILIKASEDADAEELKSAFEKISKLKDRIDAGEDFAAIAREYSEGPSNVNGGELGEFGHGQMVPPFDRAAFALEVGEVSDPVQTQFGYHLIKLTAKNANEKIEYEDIKQQISAYLADLKLEELMNTYVTDLRQKADIKTF